MHACSGASRHSTCRVQVSVCFYVIVLMVLMLVYVSCACRCLCVLDLHFLCMYGICVFCVVSWTKCLRNQHFFPPTPAQRIAKELAFFLRFLRTAVYSRDKKKALYQAPMSQGTHKLRITPDQQNERTRVLPLLRTHSSVCMYIYPNRNLPASAPRGGSNPRFCIKWRRPPFACFEPPGKPREKSVAVRIL